MLAIQHGLEFYKMTNFAFKEITSAPTVDLVAPPVYVPENTSDRVIWIVGAREYELMLIDNTKDRTINPSSRNINADTDPTNGFMNWQFVNETQLFPWDTDIIGYLWAAAQAGVIMKISVGSDNDYREYVTRTDQSLTVDDFALNPTDANQVAYNFFASTTQ